MHGSFLLTVCGVVLLAHGTVLAAEATPSVRLRIPFANGLAENQTAIGHHSHCIISGEQAMRIERDTSDPCLASDAASGGACFDRLGLGALRSQRALLPHDGGRRCVE